MKQTSQAKKPLVSKKNIIVFIIFFALGFASVAGYLLYKEHEAIYTAENAEAKALASPVKIKSLPIEIAAYDAATGKAGEVAFPSQKFPEGVQDMIFYGYGLVMPSANTAQGIDKVNPQPTFLAPVGTKVRALIDGEVIAVNDLYSKDQTIHMQGKGSNLIFETEHVMNVVVKVGDQVKAGQVIAEVSDYSTHSFAGLGMVEIGVLVGNQPPTHACTFDFLDESIKTDALQKISQLQQDWEAFRGDSNIYGEEVIAGCINRIPVSDNNDSQTGAAKK